MAAPRLSSSSSSSNQSIHNRDFWTEFFLLYESLPALWNTSSALYNDRAAKVAGYDVMVEKLREIEPNADREDVLRKINIFRTNFRREISRVNLSEKLGKQYKTTLWYFNLLSFLRNQEKRRHKKNSYDEKCVMPKRRLTGLGSSFVVKKPRLPKTRNHKSAFDEFDENEFEEVAHNERLPANSIETSNREHFQNEFTNFSLDRKIQPKLEPVDEHVTDVIAEEIDGVEGFVHEEGEVELEDNETRQKEEDEHNGAEAGGGIAINEQVTAEANWYEDAEATRRVRKQITQKNNNNKKLLSQHYSVLSKHVKNIEVQTSEVKSIPKNSSVAADILAKSWAIQYEEMADDQKIYARKAIADILFDGCMGNLGRYTVQTNNVQILRPNSVSNVEHEVRNERTLLKQQHATQRYENVMNEFEECYVLDDGRAVKIKDWKVKI